MNQAPPNPAAAAAAAVGTQQFRVLRPEQMRSISYLTTEEKQKYEEGLRQLWAKVENNDPNTQEHQQGKAKLMEFSRMVLNKVRTLHARSQADAQSQQGQPGQQGPGAPGQQGQQGQQAGQARQTQSGQTQNAGVAAATATATATTGPRPSMQINRPQIPASGNNVANAGPSMNNPAMNNPAAAAPVGQVQQTIPKHIVEHISKLPWSLLSAPSQLSPEQTPKWLNEMKQKYARALMQMETIKGRLARLDNMMKERQERNQPMSPEEMRKFQESKTQDQKIYSDADKFVRHVRTQMQAGQAQQAGQNAAIQGQNNGQQHARPQTMQTQNTGATTSSHPMQAMTASVNAAIDTAKNQQLAATNRTGSTGQPQIPQTPATPATPVSASAPQQPVHPTVHPTPAPQPQVKVEPGSHLPHPPPVNTTIAAASNANLPSAGTPTQTSAARVQTPQSTTQQAPGLVRPLTHSMAVNRANSSANITGQPNMTTPGAATTAGAANIMNNNQAQQPGHPHAHPQPPPGLTPRMPIPKTLHEKATALPQPVTLGGGNTAGRPTYGGGNGAGVNNQPVVSKMPVPQFDAEGDHVLSKKKLDELVRQVCGGGTPGADGNYLTPDVEESVLNVADNFVDTVLHTACRLAKERGSKVLEIRDIQLVLERVYNIRIPGYTSDELRTVRKVQPSPNWIAKMSAIQAAKAKRQGRRGGEDAPIAPATRPKVGGTQTGGKRRRAD
ncbi:transcription initiation factor TFIID subunit A-domain-containing protein [Camillea tinctor]|nr:transcription initiation factor TFIID subunit A-domain-containing protein [Camillea tinctor]